MQLSDEMNFSEIGEWIMLQQSQLASRCNIEEILKTKFDWSNAQIFAATDPYYDEKKFVSETKKVKRTR